MPIDSSAKSEQIAKLRDMAMKYKNDHQKIKFYDDHMEAFFFESNTPAVTLNENLPKDIYDAFYVYANMKRMNEEELEKFKGLNWKDFPDNFKIFLFDFCISN